ICADNRELSLDQTRAVNNHYVKIKQIGINNRAVMTSVGEMRYQNMKREVVFDADEYTTHYFGQRDVNINEIKTFRIVSADYLQHQTAGYPPKTGYLFRITLFYYADKVPQASLIAYFNTNRTGDVTIDTRLGTDQLFFSTIGGAGIT